jgi:hypothetical protein
VTPDLVKQKYTPKSSNNKLLQVVEKIGEIQEFDLEKIEESSNIKTEIDDSELEKIEQ